MTKYFVCFIILIISTPLLFAVKKFEFIPPTPEELLMTANPPNPEEGAMILLREIILDDKSGQEWYEEHVRIKIFSTKGLEYASVELPSFKGNEITRIKGRTIRKDGAIIELSNDKIFEKQWSKGKKQKVMAKSFAFPGAEPGCIIEYIFQRNHKPRYLTWLHIQDEIYTKEYRYLFIPMGVFSLGWRGLHISSLIQPEHTEDGILVVAKDIPGFIEEDNGPPEDSIRGMGVFYYTDKRYNSSDEYWSDAGKDLLKRYEKFKNQSSSISSEFKQIWKTSATLEETLQKLYLSIQGFKNLTLDPDNSRNKDREITVNSLMECRCGTEAELNTLFAVTASYVGAKSYIGLTINKHEGTFIKEMPSKWQLTDSIAVVKIGDKYRFFSPGTAGLSYEALPGYYSEVPVFVLLTPPSFITTQAVQPKDNVAKSEWGIALKDEGTYTINVQESLTGALAAEKRQDTHNEQEDKLKKDLEETLKKRNPSIILDKFSINDRTESNKPFSLAYDYHYKDESVQNERVVCTLPLPQIFGKDIFSKPTRNTPLCLDNKRMDIHHFELILPARLHLSSLPNNVTLSAPEMKYNLMFSKNEQGHIIVQRELEWNFDCVDIDRYIELKNLWKQIEQADQISFMLISKGGAQ